MKSNYSQKLLDPRWQKKRLEILNRDEFHCKSCYNSEATLHVHHRRYFPGRDPWDIDNEYLITLCESCHAEETDTIKEATHDLVEIAKGKFFASDIKQITNGLLNVGIYYDSNVTASIIDWWLSNKLEEMGKTYFKYLNDSRPNPFTDEPVDF